MTVQRMQWKPIADINEVPKFTEADRECFTEIRDVLKKHNCLDRFGVMLVHRHFDINDDEEMMEYTDFDNRVLTIKPVKKADIDYNEVTTTNWKFTEGNEVVVCGCVCARTPSSHLGYHRKTNPS